MQLRAFMLVHPKYNKSGRILATQLGLIPTYDITKIGSDDIIAVRYGNAGGEFIFDTTYNKPDVIRLCGDSFKFSEWCKENDVNSPVYTPFHDAKIESFPFLVRRKFHISGTDIIVVKSKEDIPSVDSQSFHVNFIECDREFGVHFVAGKVVKIFEKKPFDDNSHPFIRSSKFGYHYKVINNIEDNFKALRKLCEDTASKLELGFGRFDIGYSISNKRYIIFEVNTAPGLNVNTSNLYAEILRPVLNLTGNSAHEDNRTI